MRKLSSNFTTTNWPEEIKEISIKEIIDLEDRISKKDFDAMPIIAGRVVERALQQLYPQKNKNERYLNFVELINLHNTYDTNALLIDALHYVRRIKKANSHPSDKIANDFASSLYLMRAVAIVFYYLFGANSDFIFSENYYSVNFSETQRANDLKKTHPQFKTKSINENEVKITKIELWNLIENNNVIFLIPFYQRNYTWKDEEIDAFLEDLEERAKDGNLHYFGMLAVKIKPSIDENITLRIIDGQQRLTTCLLLLKAAYDTLKETKKAAPKLLNYLFEFKNQLGQRYINETASEENKNELISILNNPIEGTHEGKTLYSKNYNKIKKYFLETNNEKINELTSTFISKFVIGLVDFKESQQNREMDIFKNLNSKGMHLNNWDLIRNHIFNLTSDNISETKKVQIMYEKFEKNFSIGFEKKESMEEALDNLITGILYKESVNPVRKFKFKDNYSKTLKVYKNFKNCYDDFRFENEGQYTQFVIDLNKYGQIYKALLWEDVKQLSRRIDNITTSFNYLHKKVLFYIVMILFDKYAIYKNEEWFFENETKKAALETGIKILDVYIQRYQITQNHFGTSWGPQTLIWAAALNNTKPLTELLKVLEEDIPVKDSILNERLENRLGEEEAKNLLLRIQEALVNDKKEYFYYNPLKDPQLEHVMPQENSKWKPYLRKQGDDWEDKYDTHLNKIGNLYILPKKKNGELGNETFENKKLKLNEQYGYYPLIIGSKKNGITGLKEINEWSFERISERSKELAWFITQNVLSLKKLRDEVQKIER